MGTPVYEIKSFTVVRASGVLTTAYVATTSISATGDRGANQVTALIDFTLGSLTDALVKFEWSDDNSTFFGKTIANSSAGVTVGDEFQSPLRIDVQKLDTTDKYAFTFPVLARYVRASIKGEGTVTNSLATISLYAGAV